MACGDCFYLEYIDGVGFCNYFFEDVCLDDVCKYFVMDDEG